MGYTPAEADSHQEEVGAHVIMLKKGLGENLDQSDRWWVARAGKGALGHGVKCGNSAEDPRF